MTEATRTDAAALSATDRLALAMADDELLTGHHLGYWVARAPTIEEDNAMSSVVQDEMGHARLWYEVVAEGSETDLVDLAFDRPVDQRRNSVIVEPPFEDYGETVVRNLVYNEAERLLVEAIEGGSDGTLAERAEVILDEEPYHREHASTWTDRLVATEEGRSRIRGAVERTLPNARDYFAFPEDLAATLVEEGVLARTPADLRGDWVDAVSAHLADLPLEFDRSPADVLVESPETNGRAGEHTQDLAAVVDSGITSY